MKKYGWILVLAVALFAPVSAQAQVCFWTMCDWLAEDFEDATVSDWNPTQYVSLQRPNDSCYSGSPLNYVAQMSGSSQSISKTFFVDDDFSTGTQFELDFRLTILNDTDNYYDVITVSVIDNTANTTETFYVRASDYDSSCNDINPLVLSNNYLNHQVTVELTTGYLTLCDFQLDQISFWQN